MANIDGPFGFRPVGSIAGGAYTGTLVECVVLAAVATDVFIGDLVKLDGTGDTSGRPSVIAATAGSSDAPIFGAVTGFKANPLNLEQQYAEGDETTDRIALVAPASSGTLFVAQEDGAMAVTDIGSTVDIIVDSGSEEYGTSGMEIDSSTAGTGGSGQLQVMGLYRASDNEIGTNARWIVRVTETQVGQTAVTLGV